MRAAGSANLPVGEVCQLKVGVTSPQNPSVSYNALPDFTHSICACL